MESMFNGADRIELRSRLCAMEALPTVQQGMRSLGMRSLFEWFSYPERFYEKKSPFTHPMLRPTFFFPGLRARTFYDVREFSWGARVEAEAPAIVEELETLLQLRRGFQPFRRVEDGALAISGKSVLGADERPDWAMFYLHYMGGPVAENERLCPRTFSLLRSIPRFTACSVSSFSALNPGQHITPHYGPTNAVLRVHLALTAAEGCRIQVAQDHGGWQKGKLLIFSDAFEHQVWNDGSATRIVLFFDVLHPDWRADELAVVERFIRPIGLNDFVARMEQLRVADSHLLDGKQWWQDQ